MVQMPYKCATQQVMGFAPGPGHKKANKILTAAAGFAYTALHALPLIMAANVKV